MALEQEEEETVNTVAVNLDRENKKIFLWSKCTVPQRLRDVVLTFILVLMIILLILEGFFDSSLLEKFEMILNLTAVRLSA